MGRLSTQEILEQWEAAAREYDAEADYPVIIIEEDAQFTEAEVSALMDRMVKRG